jgi:hypothetical protein
MRTTSLASAAMASIAAIAITVPLRAQGTPPAPPVPPEPPPGAIAPRAPEPPRPPRTPLPGERVRILRRFADDSAMRNRPTLGMTLAPTGTVRDTIGVFVVRVVPGGPAERAGIIEGDRIVSIDGVSLKVNPADVDDPYAAGLPVHRVSRAVEKLAPGKTVTLRVWGNGRYRDVTVTTGRAGDVYKRQPFMIYSMDDAMVMPALAAVGPALESVGPTLERIGPMLERMGPMIDESVRGALRELPRHMELDIDDDAVPPPPPDHPGARTTH